MKGKRGPLSIFSKFEFYSDETISRKLSTIFNVFIKVIDVQQTYGAPKYHSFNVTQR
jgi:hypothetical protein